MRSFLQMLIQGGKNGWLLVGWSCCAMWGWVYVKNRVDQSCDILKGGFTALRRTNNDDDQQHQIGDMERELEEIKQKQLNQ